MTTIPFGAYAFTVEIDGESIAYPFRSCSGLREESSVVEVEEGGVNEAPRQLIGRSKYPPLVLKRGFCGALSELYRLRRRVFDESLPTGAPAKNWSTPHRFSGVITQLGPDGRSAKWRFIKGWISKWEGPDFDASKNELSIESVEIRHEGLRMLVRPADGERDGA
jgi:phage tail-like protein